MKKILMIILPFVLLTACVDTLDDWNVDQKKASVVPARTLFTNALKGLTDALTTPNVNNNNYRMFVQYWATTTYLDEPRYNMTQRTYSLALWNSLYRDVLSDLKECRRLVEADETLAAGVKSNQLALIGIVEVYTWTVLINTFGDIPYSEALDPAFSLPAYDDAATIYADLVIRLDGALGQVSPADASFGTADLIYSGSAAKWVKFGNSLKLRMGMLLADVDNGKAKTMVEAAAPNVIASNADNGRFPYISAPPNNNPISANLNPLFSSREDFVIASAIIDAMVPKQDPRSPLYFTNVKGEFKGGRYGFSNTYANFSHVSAKIIEPTFEALLIDYSEVEFLLAEAVERGYNVGGTAEEHYENAIIASMTYWGATEGDPTKQKAVTAGVNVGGTGYTLGDVLDVTGGGGVFIDPLAPTPTQFKVSSVSATGEVTGVTLETAGEYSTPPTGALAATGGTGTGATFNAFYDGGYKTYLLRADVAYATAPGTYKQKIGTQKWIAMNNRGWDSWVEWRRLDAPTLTPPTDPSITTALKIPVRMIFPVNEQTVNGDQWATAAARYNSDSPDVKLFWDVN